MTGPKAVAPGAPAPGALALTIVRFTPGEGAEPVEQSYVVPAGVAATLADALVHVRDTLDATLAFRACGGECRSACGVVVDGIPRLACATRLESLGEVVRVAPLANFPVIRDLVVDFSDFERRLRVVRPWMLDHGAGVPEQSESRRDRYAGFAECTLCGLCHAACPVVGLVPGFLGPAAITAAVRWNLDSRERGGAERTSHLEAGTGVWECSEIGSCSRVCPAGVDPARAIELAKRAAETEVWSSLPVAWRRG